MDKKGKLLRRMEELERKIFDESVSTLLNKNSVLVLAENRIASRVDAVESKSLLNRRTGKEGHVVSFVACSFTSLLYGFRLRMKGET